MGHVTPTDSGKFRANWREPDGKQRAKTFKTRKEANAYLAEVESSKNAGRYVNPHAGRTLFAVVAERWLASRNDQPTTIARDASIMANHVLAKWAGWPVGRIEHLDVQDWVTELGGRLAPATVAECHRLMRAVLGAAVRHLLIGSNPSSGSCARSSKSAATPPTSRSRRPRSAGGRSRSRPGWCRSFGSTWRPTRPTQMG
ncbi:hypothetical protein [Actinosynnema sp. NPDC023587]|uniref:hypothetical protein n=1 Tax=Actinosynnema sp. NPDC023587 TaxID=3154695 RepID=UPI0034056250